MAPAALGVYEKGRNRELRRGDQQERNWQSNSVKRTTHLCPLCLRPPRKLQVSKFEKKRVGFGLLALMAGLGK